MTIDAELRDDLDTEDELDADPNDGATLAEIVAAMVAAISTALALHIPAAYDLGRVRVEPIGTRVAGTSALKALTNPQQLAVDRLIGEQIDYLELGLAPDLLSRLELATDVDEIDAAFAAVQARAEMYAGSAWSAFQRGFRDFGYSGQQVEWWGPDDERTCNGCQQAVEGGPYMIDAAPIPGEMECLTNCRHELRTLSIGPGGVED